MSAGYAALVRLYHAWVTGLILVVVTRRGGNAAAELVFACSAASIARSFSPVSTSSASPTCRRRSHWRSTIVSRTSSAACAPSTSARASARPGSAPRWIWQRTAICAVPSEVSRAMLRGWHAENGVRLGDPRLGFVCTKQTVDGQDALEGYFPEHDRTLRPEERFALCSSIRRRRRGCRRRLGRSSGSPKARRNCAKDYIGSVLPELIARFATAEARSLGGRSADLTGLQLADELKAMLGVAADGAEGFAERSAALRQRRLIKPPRRRRAMPSSFRRRAGT